MPELAALAPKGDRRMGANPYANGGLLRRELELPDLEELCGRRRRGRAARRPKRRALWATTCAT